MIFTTKFFLMTEMGSFRYATNVDSPNQFLNTALNNLIHQFE